MNLKQNMLNKNKEEVHANTLTNLGTEKECVCVCKIEFDYLTNLGETNEF